MKRYISTLVLAGALLCPSLSFANAVPIPREQHNMLRSSWQYFMGAAMAGSYWMFVFFEL